MKVSSFLIFSGLALVFDGLIKVQGVDLHHNSDIHVKGQEESIESLKDDDRYFILLYFYLFKHRDKIA